jgi:predicted kinase
VIIDRTNFDAAQRMGFLKLAEQQSVAAYGVVLHLDVSICVKRAIERTDHEGGLQVRNAASWC